MTNIKKKNDEGYKKIYDPSSSLFRVNLIEKIEINLIENPI